MLHEEMLCYAQNRLFSLIRETTTCADECTYCDNNIDILVDYCVIPKYDAILDEQTEQEVNELAERVGKEVGWSKGGECHKEDFARCAIHLANNLPYGVLKAMDVYRNVHK